MADAKSGQIDPWSSSLEIKDYEGEIVRWGLSTFENILNRMSDPHYLMKRDIVFAHRDFEVILDCIENGKPYVMMTGLMPSGKMHLGHKLVVDMMKWYQDHGAELVIAISDVEALVARGIPPSKAKKVAVEEYIANFMALGLDVKNHKVAIYSQWSRPELMNLAQAFSSKRTLGEMNNTYGFAKPKAELAELESNGVAAIASTNTHRWGGTEDGGFIYGFKKPEEKTMRGSPEIKYFARSLLDSGVNKETIRLNCYDQGWAKDDVELALDEIARERLEKPSEAYDWSITAGKTFFPFVQVADIMHPQLSIYGGPRPVVVPVGIDQDPHMRLTRDIADKCRVLSVAEAPEQGFVSVYLHDEDPKKLEALRGLLVEDYGLEAVIQDFDEGAQKIVEKRLIERIPNVNGLVLKEAGEAEIEYLSDFLKDQVDTIGSFDITNNRIGIFVSEQVKDSTIYTKIVDKLTELGYKNVISVPEYRAVYLCDPKEIDMQSLEEELIVFESGINPLAFFKPSMTYNKLARGLTGGKMSSSEPETAIFLTDKPEAVSKKIKSAPTGGRETAALQREKGGNPAECVVYELLKYHHPDDDFVQDVFSACLEGKLLCGSCKSQTSEYFEKWIAEHNLKRDELLESGEVAEFVESQHIIKKGDPLFW